METAREILQASRLCALSFDPQASPKLAPRLLVLANGKSSCVLDVTSCAEQLHTLWQYPCAYGSIDAKRLHQTLLGAGYEGPERWACAQINEQLLAASHWPPDNATQGHAPYQRFDLHLPDVHAGVEQLILYTQLVWRLLMLQGQALRQKGMESVARIEARAVAPIAEMERRGMPFDAARFRAVVRDDQRAKSGLEQEISLQLGISATQVQDPQSLLRALRARGHNLDNLRRDALAQLPEPLGPKLLRLQHLAHNIQTYGEAFATHARHGRIFATFSQIGSTTGRMACHNPNLQAMTQEPRRRACFRAQASCNFAIADYNACELRILAHMSEDPAFCQAFAEGADVHSQIAKQIFGSAASEDTMGKQRQIAKIVSFGLIYGMGTSSLARTLKLSHTQADDLQRRYFQRFSKVRAFLFDSQAQTIRRGFAETLSHRRLALPVDSQDRDEKASMQRIARNMPIQGTGADILKIALARLRRALPGYPEHGVVHCIHDEIVAEITQDQGPWATQLLAQHMKEAAGELVTRVPMHVDSEVRHTWSHQK